MRLPGGLCTPARERNFAFRPLSGRVELALAEAAAEPSFPAAVTAILAAALAHVGGVPASPALVRGLAVGDRQFLARRLAAALGRDSYWLRSSCTACGEKFDLLIETSRLPVKEAGPSFPFAEVPTRRGRLRLRAPTGADQEAIAEIPAIAAARRALFERCLVSGAAAVDCGEDEVAAAEAAVEDMAPEVVLSVATACPECGRQQAVELDPYFAFGSGGSGLLEEVHTLAAHYHWSERQILALPIGRRRQYLRLIDNARGVLQ